MHEDSMNLKINHKSNHEDNAKIANENKRTNGSITTHLKQSSHATKWQRNASPCCEMCDIRHRIYPRQGNSPKIDSADQTF